MRHWVYITFLLLAAACALAFVVARITSSITLSGWLVVAAFILLALGLRGFATTRGASFGLWIFAAVSAGLFYPEHFLVLGGFKLDQLIVPLLQIIMFGMGSQLSLADFAGVLRMPKGIAVGIVSQFTIMPLVGLAVASLFGFPAGIAAGIVLIGASPSGLASNVMSFLARANVALSVTLTTITTFLSPLLTPLLMRLLGGQFIHVDFLSMMLGIINMVILPIIAGLAFNLFSYGTPERKRALWQLAGSLGVIALTQGLAFAAGMQSGGTMGKAILLDGFWFLALPVGGALLFRSAAKGRREWLDKALAFISMAGITIILSLITAAGSKSLLAMGLILVGACFVHNTAGYFLGYWACRLLRMPERDCRTISLEVGMQNAGLASGLAMQMGKVASVGLAAAVFGPLMNVTGSTLAAWWRSREPKD